MPLEVIKAPHISIDVMRDPLRVCMLTNTAIGEVCVPIVDVLVAEVSSRESNVGLLVQPDCERVPVCHKDPLPDVELSFHHNHRVFNILLNDVLAYVLPAYLHDLIEVLLQANSTTARASCRLHDPDVTFAVHVKLRVLLFEELDKLEYFCKLRMSPRDLGI